MLIGHKKTVPQKMRHGVKCDFAGVLGFIKVLVKESIYII